MKIRTILLLFVLLLVVGVIFYAKNVSGCGWFTYEDAPETRAYYNGSDILVGIEDSTLQISRFPNPQEIKMNVFIPMNYNG